MPAAKTFVARVKKHGVNPYVDVPADIGRTLERTEARRVLVRLRNAEPGASRPPPVHAEERERLVRIGRMARDGSFRTTIVPVRGAAHRLFLDTWMRGSAGLTVGDRVQIELRTDRWPRDPSVPAALEKALARDPRARSEWERWSPSRRKQALAYLNFLKSEEALERTIRKLLSDLRGEARRAGATSSGKPDRGSPAGVLSRKG